MTKQIKNLLTRYWAVIILILLLLLTYSTNVQGYGARERASSSDVVEDKSTIDELNYYNKAVEEALTEPIETACQEVEEYYEKEEEKNRPKLNNKDGIFFGPNGKETYYNLNMKEVVARMHRLGYSGDYWIREDGVKMFGDYVMVAANLRKFPRGTIVDTSLGKGIVCDTGGFVYNGSGVVFDIAVQWT